MTTELWQRAQIVFDQALDTPAAGRTSFLDVACAGDSRLRRAVDDLLAADRDDGTLLSGGAAVDLMDALEEQSTRPWMGRDLGSYRVIDILGRGGMGAVFLAERCDAEFEMRVAIKVLPLWMSSPDNLRRFRRERQILALLEHPNIARLVDGGTTDEGQPFLAMEYVEGRCLTDYCDAEGLDLRQRIALLRTVCAAVSYAHQRLVVHRDLKSSNIMVTHDGVAKLLDFGIAKLLDPAGNSGLGQPTVTEERRLTPDYASPEQLSGKPLTTATDVYSLGVLCFEVLTGSRPFSWQGSSWSQIEATLQHRRPPLMSARVGEATVDGAAGASTIAGLRRTRAGALQRALSGDLDNIIGKALRTDPAERYGTVHELAEDLGRFLDGLPVEARPAGWWYRTGKWLRRHAIAATIAVAAVLTVSGFAVVTYLQARQLEVERDAARREQARAEQVSQLLLDSFEQADPSTSRGEMVTAREILDNGARRVGVELRQQPGLAATMRNTIGKVQARLGLYEEAQRQLGRALEQRRTLFGDDHPRVAESLHEWGFLQLKQGELETAEATLRQALAIRETAQTRVEYAETLHLLAEVRRSLGARQEAIDLHSEALELQRLALGEEHPGYVEGLTLLARGLRLHGSGDRAESLYRRALEIQGRLYPGDHPVTAAILGNLARLQEQRQDLDGAAASSDAALQMNLRLYDGRHPRIASSLSNLAGIERLRGKPKEALEHHHRALAMLQDLLGPEHPRLAGLLYNLALTHHRDLGRPQEAEALYRQAIEILRNGVGDDHVSLGFFRVGLGSALGELGRHREAEEQLRQALDLFSRLSRGGAEGRNAAMAKSELATLFLRQGRVQEAEDLLLPSYRVLKETLGEDHRVTLRAAEALAELQERTATLP